MRDIFKIGQKILEARFMSRMRLLTVEFCVTYRCNLNCKYCGQGYKQCKYFRPGCKFIGSQDGREEMSSQQINQALDNLRQVRLKRINISGGEPLLREDLGEILDSAYSKDFFVSLTTNGILIPQKIDLLKKINLLIISLDGTRKTTDYLRGENSFKQCLESIALVCKRRIPLMLSSVVTAITTEEDVDYLLNLCTDHNIYCIFNAIIEKGHKQGQWFACPEIAAYKAKEEHLKRIMCYLKQHKHISRMVGGRYWCDLMCEHSKRAQVASIGKAALCMAGRLFLNIEASGQITPCGIKQDPIMPHKIYENDFVKRLREKIPAMACNGCFCYSYDAINQLARLNMRAIKSCIRQQW